ncbi:MAG: ribonucleoside reductase class II [bacterium]|nr:ribonucleoside reductase class II [bacterium]
MLKLTKKEKNIVNARFSENALKMMKKRYLAEHEDGTQETPADMFLRVADSLADIEKNYGKKEKATEKIARDFFEIMASKEYTPAGRTLTNAGSATPLIANCIVLPIHDSMESIFGTLKDAALLQQAGSGLGFDLSEMRPAMFPTKKSRGEASGPVSFLRVYDAAFGTIKQQSRHGANMAMMRIDHPDVLDFISCKSNEGEIRNFNISVTVTDEFMEQLQKEPDKQWLCTFKGKKVKPRSVLRHPNGSVYKSEETDISAKQLFDILVDHAWLNGEPGIAFVDTWNKANPLPDLGPLASTNPCVTGDTLVATEKGLLRMEELVQKYGDGGLKIATDKRAPRTLDVSLEARAIAGKEGEQEIAPTLSFAEQKEKGVGSVSKAWATGVKPTYKLVTRSGYELEATKEHEIFTPEGKTALCELHKGDKILLQSTEGLWAINPILPFEAPREVKGKNGRIYRYNFPTAWSKELGQVLGWLVGDGWVRDVHNQYTVGFTFSKEDKAVLERIKKIVNEWRYLNTKEILQYNGVYHLIYGSKAFVEYVKAFGVKAVRAQQKEVPHTLWQAPREAVIGFLQGLFSADGTINIYEKNQTRYIRLTSKSEKLLKQVQILLANLGVISTIYDRSRKPSIKMGYQNDGICFELNIAKTNIGIFLEKVGFLGNHYSVKAATLKEKGYYRETFEDEVKEITYAGRKKVYDLTEPLSHSFIANGFVISNCGEQVLHPYDNCNLGSLNLALFVKQNKVDYKRLRFATRAAVRLMDNVIDKFDFPVEAVTDLAKKNRRIGLGIMGFADMLFQLGIRYDSKKGFATAEKVMGFINKEAYIMSQDLAGEKGSFPNLQKSVFVKKKAPHAKAQEWGIGKKMRNAALTTVAPTGSISMLMDTSSGIEPNFALAYIKQDKDGQQYHYFNQYFKKALDRLKFSTKEQEKILKEVIDKGTALHIESLPKALREIFVVAMDISGQDHMKMQAAFQNNVDNSISKTVNFPNSATREDIANVFIEAWKLGCKSCTVYRDGSRVIQILNVGSGENIIAPTETPGAKGIAPLSLTPEHGKPRPRPEIMNGSTYRIKTGYGKLYVTVNNDERGVPFEVFATIGKSGGFFQEQSEAICRLISLALRSGVAVEEVAGDLKGIRGPMPIFTDKGTVLSLPDALGKILEQHVTVTREVQEVISRPENQEVLPFAQTTGAKTEVADFGFMPGCPDCGAQLLMQEGCISCKSCGFSRCS